MRSIKDIKEAIRLRASITPKGNSVQGFKYDDTKTSEGRKINLSDLDEAATEHPVIILHRGGHTNYCNSLAFTSATDAGGSPQDLQAYQDAYESGDLHIRIYCMIYYTYIDKMIAAGVRTGMGDDWVKIGG